MNDRKTWPLLTLALFALTGLAAVAHGQSERRAMPDYDDLPDWSGVWGMTSNTVFDQATVEPPGGSSNTPGTREYPPYNDEWEAKYAANRELVRQGRFPDPITTCGTPVGYPRLMNQPGASEFVLRPEAVWILTEDGPNIMRIHTDGREHPGPNDRWPTFSGESVGYWEGDTLVFETISLKGDGDTILDRTGIVLSEQARIVTRMRSIGPDLIEARFTIEDPEALVEPWNVVKEYRRLEPGTRMFEFACAENNRNPVDASGRTLTLDADGNVLDQQ
ncbi:hypothetical protein [Candidatus Rariloculus sp.]|uniref:hypothetical protein n=1 Tax=Candidatus Rariloculus sp. TaxID=3101265 RepID=UPI003D15277D